MLFSMGKLKSKALIVNRYLLNISFKRVHPFLKSFLEHALVTAAFCKYIVLLYFCPEKGSSSSVSASTLLWGTRDCRRGRKLSWFPPLVRDHISWRDVCCYIYATIILLYTLYCIYSYIIYYIEAENYPGFCRWFEIIFHEGIFCYIFAIIILSYTLFC